ncbi:4Fe-4S dicluster domain-containing protein [Thermanaeromonas sp. C210]|uniref:4Fe-4S dicluster domain-containing protein n=1 Tax=Thermanaeromonas sp. C210 TaxID=2731925 RepID=UPI0015648B40|nr:4Fe-4S dicluster domain-containing protein [Thermanaeromonas sp. C210]
MSYGMLIDLTLCIGCKGCQIACKQWNDLPAEKTTFNADWSNPPELTARTWKRVGHHLVQKGDKLVWRFVPQACMHCNEAACEAACFVHAFYKTPEGPVLYKENLCVGCRYCMVACPFGIPKFEWDETFPLVRKCRMCYERIADGQQPACASACPTGATLFGRRDELLAEARNRINTNPGKYVPHIYGEKEAGGTSVLYLSDVPFHELGFKTVEKGEIPAEPIPSFSDRIVRWTLPVAATWTAVLGGLYWYTKRRSEVEESFKRQNSPQDNGEGS